MSEEIPIVNGLLSPEEQSAAAKLTVEDIQRIDTTIFANSSSRWLKVARVVLFTVDALSKRYPELSYVFYARRLIELVGEGKLESQGNLEFMRFSEVRIPTR